MILDRWPSDAAGRLTLSAVLAGTVIALAILALPSAADTSAADSLQVASHAAIPPQEAVPVPGATARVRGDGDCLRLRESPSLLAAALACIPDASLVTVLEGPVTADGHDWVRVQRSSNEGWVAGEFLEVIDASAPAATVTPAAAAPTSPADSLLSGTVPAGGGVGLIVWLGDIAALAPALQALGCDFVSVWGGSGSGGFIGYVHGALPIVNREWTSRFPRGALDDPTPLAIVCRRGGSSAPVDVVVGAAVENSVRGLPATGGIGLAVWGDTIESLVVAARGGGCDFVSAWAASGRGTLVGYLHGAPAIVNGAWSDEIGAPAVAAGTPLVVVCRRSAQVPAPTPPSIAPSTSSPGDAPALRIPVPVPPDWRSRPPGPAGND